MMAAVGLVPATAAAGPPPVFLIDHVADGDTVTLRNGQRVRLVQIDTPEVYFGTECYGRQASAVTKHLLPPGTRVRLFTEPATDSVDQYGRLLRYVVRAKDRLNVNVQLVRLGAAARTSTPDGERQVRRSAGTARPSSESAEARPVGTLPAHAVRPDPRRQHAAVAPRPMRERTAEPPSADRLG
jgi:endonuclease YncB( thermonuclease family)